MTLQERFDQTKAQSAHLAQQYSQGQQQLRDLEAKLIRLDAELQLLDTLMKEQAPVLALVPDVVEGSA